MCTKSNFRFTFCMRAVLLHISLNRCCSSLLARTLSDPRGRTRDMVNTLVPQARWCRKAAKRATVMTVAASQKVDRRDYPGRVHAPLLNRTQKKATTAGTQYFKLDDVFAEEEEAAEYRRHQRSRSSVCWWRWCRPSLRRLWWFTIPCSNRWSTWSR